MIKAVREGQAGRGDHGISAASDVALTAIGPGAIRRPFQRGRALPPGHDQVDPRDGDTVIVLWDGHGIANDGQPYENSYAWIMRLRHGKVVDGTAFYDGISFNRLWERVRP